MKKALKCHISRILCRTGVIEKYISREKSVRILMYHRIQDGFDRLGLTISPAVFSAQLQYLKKHFTLISLAEAVDILSSGVLTKNYCVITFDDGYRDNYDHAFPLLIKHDVPATIFVTCNAIETGQFGWATFDRTLLTTPIVSLDLSRWGLGTFSLSTDVTRQNAVEQLHRLLKQRPDAEKQAVVAHVVAEYGVDCVIERSMMSWEEIRELADSPLITIGAHTITHPILSRVELDQARNEVIGSKILIEDKIGKLVDFFAYPNGRAEDIGHDVVKMVQDSGFRAACATITGFNTPVTNHYLLRRIDVTNSISTDVKDEFSPYLFAFNISGILWRLREAMHNISSSLHLTTRKDHDKSEQA